MRHALLVFTSLSAAFVFTGCAESPLPSGGTTAPMESSSQGVTSLGASGSSSLQDATGEFTCDGLQGAWVRFSEPGFIVDEQVGLFARYEGVPVEEAMLRLWWDYEHDGARYQNVQIGPDRVQARSDGLFDLELIVEHTYTDLAGPTELMVRTELILPGQTGNCARNRRISVTPSVDETKPGSPKTEGIKCKGVRFCDLGDGTVLDKATKVTWLKDAGCVFPRRLARAMEEVALLGSGQCGLTDGSAPGAWRLPTRAELNAILDPRFTDPRLSNARGDSQWSEGDAFLRVRNLAYWSSDTSDACIASRPGAWVVSVGRGTNTCRIQNLPALIWPVK